jgi:hypothetical protein
MAWIISNALMKVYGNSLCLQEQEAEFSAEHYLDGEQCAPLRLTDTQLVFLQPDKMTEYSRLFRFGMTFAPLTAGRGTELLTLFLADFPVRTFPLPERGKECAAEKNPDYGSRWLELLAKYDRNTCSWKTLHSLPLEDSTSLLETLPKWGMTRNGELLEQTMPDFPTIEKECGYWATPAARDWKDTPRMSKVREKGKNRIDTLPRQIYSSLDGSGLFKAPTIQLLVIPDKNNLQLSLESNTTERKQFLLNPTWVEWLMGWPLEWTGLRPLEMDKFQQWLLSHGES